LKQFEQHKALKSENLIIGLENPDDGGVINVGDTKIIQTVDFFTPILDNPYDWGRVAAANSLSDIYAMGGEPVSALQLVCWPRDEISFDVLAEVINGGLDIMAEAGCTVIGGHSIDDKEPKYGFSVTGVIKDNPILNNNILDKDKLFITKPLGIGIIATAIKKGVASDDEILEATNIMASLNKKAMEFAKDYKANAITDVTGFGLLGHLSEMLKGSKLSATIYSEKVPVINGVEELLEKDIFPSGSKRNLESIRDKLIFDIDNKKIQIFSDAQTSGGLLISLPNNVNIESKEVKEKYGIDVWEIGEITTQYNEKINII
jgi:selenide,water dikinase